MSFLNKLWNGKSNNDRYYSFDELQENERVNIDFRITVKQTNSTWSIIAPHGGGIEPGTSEIAGAIARNDFSLYLFEGYKFFRNIDLHITSTNFNEPQLLHLLQTSNRTIAIHGLNGDENIAYIGGRDNECIEVIIEQLSRDGFTALHSQPGFVEGISLENICNKNTAGRGVQIELTNGLRNLMFANLSRTGREFRTPTFDSFVSTIRNVIQQLSQ